MVKARELAHGINRLGRSQTISRKKRYLHFGKGPQKKEEAKVTKRREPRWYAADDIAQPIKSRKNHHKRTKLRSSITPGTVLIVLAGRFKGKRVVFLKQLLSGLLLVTGPYKINGVPLRRINQAYVIATTTKVDVSKIVLNKISDKLFKRAVKAKKPVEHKAGDKKSEEKAGDKKTDDKSAQQFFKKSKKKKKKTVSEQRKTAQKSVDTPLLESIKEVSNLHHYLNAKFSLTNGVFPHAVKF